MGTSVGGSAFVGQSVELKQLSGRVCMQRVTCGKGRTQSPELPYGFPPVAQAPTYPLRGLLGSTGSWQERAEKPVPKEHPRCLDPLLPLSVDQEHGEALDRRVSTRPLKVRE